MSKEINVIVKGFRSDEHAKAFIKWFEGAGEQMQDNWFQIEGLQGQITDISKTFPIHRDKNGNWVLELQ